jgi:uncharacterized protein with HEPN domain
VIWSLEVIGEAIKKLPEDFKRQYSHVPWWRMTEMRDKLIDDYFEVDHSMVWDFITREVPQLHQDINEIA